MRALLGDAPRRRDLLIEHLHQIQDRYGCLSAAHLVALAAEMKMAMAEVYEVATFYHHFDVVKEGETRAAGDHGARLRLDRLRAGRLARRCSRSCPACSAPDVRVLHAPCVGRCETAPVAVVGQNPVPHATVETGGGDGARRARHAPAADDADSIRTSTIVTPGHIDYAAYRAGGGYALAAACVGGRADAAPTSSR